MSEQFHQTTASPGISPDYHYGLALACLAGVGAKRGTPRLDALCKASRLLAVAIDALIAHHAVVCVVAKGEGEATDV